MGWQRLAGEPVRAGDITVTPYSQLLSLRLPFGSFVWQRPTHVVVERGGRVERLAIVDVTRGVQVGLLALSLALIFVISRLTAPRRRGRRRP